MELLQLKYFRAAAEYENFSRAAALYNVPQSSISKTIANLEQELGYKLFSRSGKRVVLNNFGQAFLAKVDLALNSLDDGRQTLAELAEQQQGNIRLAIWEGSRLLPRILTDFRVRHSQARFSLIQHTPVQHALTAGPAADFDLCISALPLEDEHLAYTELLTEEIQLALPVRHPLSGNSTVSLADLKADSFISLASCKSLRRMTDASCYLAGFEPKVIFESDDAATVRGLIENGLGVAFIPIKSWQMERSDQIRFMHIADIECQRTLAISWHKDRFLSALTQEFRQFVIEWCQRL